MPFPPGPKGHFITGNLKDLVSRVLDFISGLQEQYGDVVVIRFAFRKVFYVQHPDIIRHILQENHRNYTKSLRYEQFKYLLGDGLLTSEGEYWLRQRRLIQPAFYKERIRSLGADMVTCAEEMTARWKQMPPGTSMNVSREMMALTLDIVGKSLLSADVRADVDTVGKALGYLLHSVNRRTRTPILLPLWIPTPSHRKIKSSILAINEVLERVFAAHEKPQEGRNDLLDMLMASRYEDTGEPMNRKQLRDEVMTLFVAGHETTANALTWTLYLLSQHEDARMRCVNEIQEVTGGRSPAADDVPKLRYITAVIEESMRIYPPAWMIGRRAIQDDKLGTWTIPAGFNVLINPYAMHRDKRYWKEPEKFDPERFLEPAPDRPKFAYLPFGGGPRMCIGNNFAMMEMVLTLAVILRNFKPIYRGKSKPVCEPLITLRPKGGMEMEMEMINYRL